MKKCRYKDNHYEHDCLNPCECGYIRHVYKDEPYCDLCAKPFELYYNAIKRLLPIRYGRKYDY